MVIVQLLEAVDECHCERPQGAKQSLKIASSLSLLAMTRLLPEAELLPIMSDDEFIPSSCPLNPSPLTLDPFISGLKFTQKASLGRVKPIKK